jgi:Mn2+/Fe2+ NRAMP family transporter
MVPAMVMIYFEQLLVVLRIATIYGRDPNEAARAAEILVVQGQEPNVKAAADSLRRVSTGLGKVDPSRDSTFLGVAISSVPSMLGLRVRKFKDRGPLEILVFMAGVASFFLPIVSIPVWVFANARATRRLGRAAIRFYTDPANDSGAIELDLPPGFSSRTRRWTIAVMIPIVVGFGLLAALFHVGRFHVRIVWLGVALAELALVLTFWRLLRVTRPSSQQAT